MQLITKVGGGRLGFYFCALEKSLDCINHRILLHKLEFCGIVWKILYLIKSYIHDIFQIVLLFTTIARYNVSYSKWEEVKNGVPQGSILGPFLFRHYINDLPKIATKDTDIICLGTIQAL